MGSVFRESCSVFWDMYAFDGLMAVWILVIKGLCIYLQGMLSAYWCRSKGRIVCFAGGGRLEQKNLLPEMPPQNNLQIETRIFASEYLLIRIMN